MAGPQICFIEPIGQVNKEHEVASQHDNLQLLSVPVVPSHQPLIMVLGMYPVGHVYEKHENRSSAQHAASVEPTKFTLLYL